MRTFNDFMLSMNEAFGRPVDEFQNALANNKELYNLFEEFLSNFPRDVASQEQAKLKFKELFDKAGGVSKGIEALIYHVKRFLQMKQVPVQQEPAPQKDYSKADLRTYTPGIGRFNR